MPQSSGVIINVMLVIVLRFFGVRLLLWFFARPPWRLFTILECIPWANREDGWWKFDIPGFNHRD